MCDQNEKILDELIILNSNPEFHKWNTSSIDYIIYILTKYRNQNNDIIITIATKIFNDFLNWYETKPNKYMPEYGLECMYPYDLLNNISRLIKN